MTAYLCKITLRGSKPPVWWRCNIPGGISLSALSLLMDRLTGEEGEGSFSFEIHQWAKAWEPTKEDPLKAGYYASTYDAVHVAADELLEQGRAISYQRGERTYQIRVENVDEKYPFDYPLVLKAPKGTDVYEAIKRMQDGFRVEKRVEKHPKNKAEMLKAAQNGVLVLPQVSRSLKKDSPYYKESSDLRIQELAKQLRALTKEKNQLLKELKLKENWKAEPAPRDKYKLREIMGFYNRDSLEEFAHLHGVTIKRGEKKKEITDRLTEVLLEPERIYRTFVSLTDEETKAFETVVSAGGSLKISEEDEIHYATLDDAGYLFYGTDDRILVGMDIMEAYGKISTPEFHARRRKVCYLRKCLNDIVPLYYAIIPVRKLSRVCRRKTNPPIQAEEIPELIRLIPEWMHNCVIREDTVYTNQVIDDPDAMEYVHGVQGDKPYCIIREDEIDEFFRYGYPRSKKAYRDFRDYLTGELKVPEEKAEGILKHTHRLIALNFRTQSFFDDLKKEEIIPASQKQAEEIMGLYAAMIRDTHTLYNRGYAPGELRRIQGEPDHRMIRVDDAQIVVKK